MLALQVCLACLVSRPSIFELAIETRLHLCLLEEHLFAHFIDCFLIVDGHSIRHPAHFFSRLGQIPLDLLTLHLSVLQASTQLRIHLG